MIHRIEPTYPILAQQAHIQGQVVLRAIIDKDGDIQELQVVSGHPMLVPVALEAVKEWHYRPFLLNGQPVEVETQINRDLPPLELSTRYIRMRAARKTFDLLKGCVPVPD